MVSTVMCLEASTKASRCTERCCSKRRQLLGGGLRLLEVFHAMSTALEASRLEARLQFAYSVVTARLVREDLSQTKAPSVLLYILH